VIPPAPVLPDTEKHVALAAFLMLTAPSSDRALRGWDPDFWTEQELAEMSAYAESAATGGEAA